MVRFVVMAAGKASRMGQDKLALPWKETTILGHVIDTLKEALLSKDGTEVEAEVKAEPKAGVEARYGIKVNDEVKASVGAEVVVVARKPILAYCINQEEEKLKGLNNQWMQWIEVSTTQPLAETIRLGVAGLSNQVKGICFIPGDQVGLKADILAELTQFFIKTTPDFLIPKAGEGTGSPVFFHVQYLSELLALEGEQGGRRVFEAHRERWTTYPVPEEFLYDVDSLEDYIRVKAHE